MCYFAYYNVFQGVNKITGTYHLTMLCNVGLTYVSVDEILNCDHSMKVVRRTFLWCSLSCCTRWLKLTSFLMKS